MVNVDLVFKNLKKLKPTTGELLAVVASLDDNIRRDGDAIVGLLSTRKLTHGNKISIGIIRQSVAANAELKRRVTNLIIHGVKNGR